MVENSYLCPTCDSEVEVGGDCPICVLKNKPRRKKTTAGSPKSWHQDSSLDGLNLPDEDFDYDEFVKEEFSSEPHEKVGIKFYWWFTALLLVIAFVWLVIGGLFS